MPTDVARLLRRGLATAAGRRWFAAAWLLAVAAMAIVAVQSGRRPPPVPLGLAPVVWPAGKPFTPAKAELGRMLFFDKRLSMDNTVACATCHDPRFAFTDGQAVAKGVGGRKGSRNAPTVINRAYGAAQFWDGRAPTLEEQARGSIANPVEMALPLDACVAKLRGIPEYRHRFRDVYGTERFMIDHVVGAIATFERTLLSGNSPFDRYRAGDRQALSPAARRGRQVFFGKAQCDACHLEANFTDDQFAHTAIGFDRPKPDWGRFAVTKRKEDRGVFKTPTLREVVRTAPYMHDGSLKTLEEVVKYYNKGGNAKLRDGSPNPWIDDRVHPLNLTAQDQADLVTFLKSLCGEGWQRGTAS